MRVIFALLVLLNVAYLAYQQLYAVVLPSEPAAQSQTANLAANVAAGNTDSATGLRQAAQLRRAREQNGADKNGVGNKGSDKNDPEKNKLAQNDPAQRNSALSGPVASGPKPSEAPPRSQSGCAIIGPFASEAIVKSLVAQLDASGIKSEVESAEAVSLPDYLVYVGPTSTRAEARVLMDQFRAEAVDSYLIETGEYKNAISLGMFTRQPFALALRAKMRKAGFDAKISQRARKRRGFQVKAVLTANMHKLLSKEDNPLRKCEAAASA